MRAERGAGSDQTSPHPLPLSRRGEGSKERGAKRSVMRGPELSRRQDRRRFGPGKSILRSILPSFRYVNIQRPKELIPLFCPVFFSVKKRATSPVAKVNSTIRGIK